MLYQKFFVSSRRFFKFSPDSAHDGSFGGFYVKVQIIYDTDKQLVKKILNIPNLDLQVMIDVDNIIHVRYGKEELYFAYI